MNKTPESNSRVEIETTKEQIFERFGVKSMKELDLDVYMPADQELWKSGKWNYDDNTQLQNQIKDQLERLNPESLEDNEVDDKFWRNNIIWFWYHHATSKALENHDNEKAKAFSDIAMSYPENRNDITKILNYLAYDRISEAEEIAQNGMQYLEDQQSAFNVIEMHRANYNATK